MGRWIEQILTAIYATPTIWCWCRAATGYQRIGQFGDRGGWILQTTGNRGQAVEGWKEGTAKLPHPLGRSLSTRPTILWIGRGHVAN